MPENQSKLEKLIEFQQRDKFSATKWEERWLNPSDDSICQKMITGFYYATDELIKAVEKNKSQRKLKSILKQRLTTFRSWDYDTEEREFIVDLFYELSIITEVDIKRSLNRWLYGRAIMLLMDVMKIIKPRKIVATQVQPCIKCSNDLKISFYNSKRQGSPKWLICKCPKCNEYNFISIDNLSGHCEMNFFHVESLSKGEYSLEQAMIRFEQLKYFRK